MGFDLFWDLWPVIFQWKELVTWFFTYTDAIYIAPGPVTFTP